MLVGVGGGYMLREHFFAPLRSTLSPPSLSVHICMCALVYACGSVKMCVGESHRVSISDIFGSFPPCYCRK